MRMQAAARISMMRSSEIRRVRRFAAEGSGAGAVSQGGADGFSLSPASKYFSQRSEHFEEQPLKHHVEVIASARHRQCRDCKEAAHGYRRQSPNPAQEPA